LEFLVYVAQNISPIGFYPCVPWLRHNNCLHQSHIDYCKMEI